MSGVERDTPEGRPLFGSERAKAFIDAVVAIAMTLLILPLMESVSDAATKEQTAAVWLGGHWQQLLSFGLSFALIAMFWIAHHRLFAGVEHVTVGLLWLTMLWLISIVWLPVATALSGQMDPTDPLVKIIYIGTLIVTCLVSLMLRLFIRTHPQLHDISDEHLRRGLAVDISMALLFAVALALTLAFPELSYFPLFIMFLVGPVQSLIVRMLGAPRPPKVSEAAG